MSDYWDVTINTLQPLISKPTLKPPLLQKPPFRFLHDIVTGVIAATGFPNGLFDESMINSENAKSFDKDQKIQFLNRLIVGVQLAIGQVIDVSPSKIIAGLEPEKTNALLQGLADAARAAPNLDMAALIAAADAGQQPDGKTSFNKNQRAAAPAAAAAAAAVPASAAAQAAARPQRPPQQSSAAPSGALRPTRTPIQLPAGEGGEDFVATTTRLIGSLIQKPKMTDKLLRKPPFRFLHDIVTAVMAATTYPEGYFTPEELDSAAFTETNQKLAFLQKFIDLVAATNSVDLSQVNPKKIAAGLEPEQTNVLLQQFAYAAASGISARDVAAKLASSAPAAAPAAVDNSAAEAEAAAAAERKARAAAEAEARKQAALAESQRQQAAAAAAAAQQQASQPKAMPKLGLGGIDPNEESKDDDAQVRNKIERPKTARKAPPKLASNLIEEKKSSPNDEKKSQENALGGGVVIAEGEIPQEDNDDEEEEKVNMDNGAEVLSGFGDDGNDGADGMVVKAMKNKLKDAAAANDGTMKIRSSASVAGGMSQAQLDDLRKQIQLLCQSVNPLGKCIDFVREDIDSMNKELSRWRVAYTEYTDELEVERKSTERIVEPLQQSLADVEQQIAEQQRKIHAIKSSILRNDSQIAQLLDTKTAVQQ